MNEQPDQPTDNQAPQTEPAPMPDPTDGQFPTTTTPELDAAMPSTEPAASPDPLVDAEPQPAAEPARASVQPSPDLDAELNEMADSTPKQSLAIDTEPATVSQEPTQAPPAMQPEAGQEPATASTPQTPTFGAAGAAPVAPSMQPQAADSNILAIVSLVVGIVAVIPPVMFIPFVNIISMLVGAAAIVLGVLQLQKIKKGTASSGKGMAIAGISTGAVAVLVSIMVTVWMLAALG